jgi:hypothetical protein
MVEVHAHSRPSINDHQLTLVCYADRQTVLAFVLLPLACHYRPKGVREQRAEATSYKFKEQRSPGN